MNTVARERIRIAEVGTTHRDVHRGWLDIAIVAGGSTAADR
ncbi:MAG TPA: hypothetical protein VNA21_02630 [Steroidobacteraceae bacterium]|nr:hypothetical protein [Steroidobacteraceae bacterium]